MRKLIVISLLFSFSFGKVAAQQLSQFSQYLDNYYLLNPAATNLQNNVQFALGYRQQWSNLPGNPSTIYLSAYAPLSKPDESQNMRASMRLNGRVRNPTYTSRNKPKLTQVMGATLMNDDFGLFNKTTFHFSYGIHLPITEKISISAAPKVGMVYLGLNEGLWVLEENDLTFESFTGSFSSETLLDIGFGLWLYSDRFFLGYSMEQLSKNNSTQLNESVGFQFTPHHFISAGYQIPIDMNFRVIPSLMIRHTSSSPSNIDYSLRMEYRQRIWAGLSLRKSNALVGLFGLYINKDIEFNYSYDHGMASGGRDGLNAHELSIRVSAFQNLYKK